MGLEERWDPAGVQELRALYEPLRRFAAVVGRWDVDPDDLVQDAYAQGAAPVPGRHRRPRPVPAQDDRATSSPTAGAAPGGPRTRSGAWPKRRPQRVDDYPSDLDDLLRLPARVRALLYLVEIEGRSTADAAEVVGMSGANARVALMRARQPAAVGARHGGEQ